MNSQIAHPERAEIGAQKIAWARAHMPVLSAIAKRFEQEKPFMGKTLCVSVHLEAKTAVLAQVLREGGAEVIAMGSNPLSTQDDVCAALAASGVTVLSRHGCTAEEYERYLVDGLSARPHAIIDDGGDMVQILHSTHPEFAERLLGGSEETTTGVIRLKARERANELRFPMVLVNDADCKHLFDNRYGTGQSVWDGILRTTNLTVAGSTVVVAGYGWCGRGTAMRAKGLGARVIVTEVDPVKAIEAVMDGFMVLPMEQAAPLGDFFVTVTGCEKVITTRHFPLLKDGAVLSNAGHFDVEVDVAALRAYAARSFPGPPEHRRLRSAQRQNRLPAGRRAARQPRLRLRPSGGNYGYEFRPAGALRRIYHPARRGTGKENLRRAARDRRAGGGAEAGIHRREDRRADSRAGEIPRRVGVRAVR